MLKLPTHSGFHDLFLKHTSFTQVFEQNYYLYSTYTKVKKTKKNKKNGTLMYSKLNKTLISKL
jgi:hypothetical protein